MKNGRSALGVVLSKLGALLVFLILLGLANIIAAMVESQALSAFVAFLNNNIGIIILFSIIFFFAELFSIFLFPFNLPYPIFNAFGSAYLIIFLARLLGFVNSFTSGALDILMPFMGILLVVVPVIVLILGFVHIFVNLFRRKRKHRHVRRKRIVEEEEY